MSSDDFDKVHHCALLLLITNKEDTFHGIRSSSHLLS